MNLFHSALRSTNKFIHNWQMFNRIKIFIQESRRELRRVNWPTRQETKRYTLFVIGLSLVVASFLGLLDFIFVYILENVLI